MFPIHTDYCISHVTLPNRFRTFFCATDSNCCFSINSWRIHLKLELYTLLYVIFVPDRYYCYISNSCFWVPGVISVSKTALANAEHHRTACYCAITSSDITSMCSEKIVLFGEHPIEGKLMYSACPLPFVYSLKLNATVFGQWHVH